MKKVGIFLNFDPSVKLYREGLGRLLVNIIKGGVLINKRYVIACPSWSRKSLSDFFEEENINLDNVEFVGPKSQPFSLIVYEWLLKEKSYNLKRKFKILKKITSFCQLFLKRCLGKTLSLSKTNFFIFCLLLFTLIYLSFKLFFDIFILFIIILAISIISFILFSSIKARVFQIFLKILNKLSSVKRNFSCFELYENISFFETKKIIAAINQHKEVDVWFCPTVFWPEFNLIKAAKVAVVPDIVLEDFPVGFAKVSNKIHDKNLEKIRKTISNCEHFITYSDNIKYSILIDRFHKTEENIRVIKHGWTDLSQYIDFNVKGNLRKSQETWTNRVAQALTLLKNYSNFKNLPANGFDFIFYSSQNRPNKNIFNLIKAYSILVHHCFLSHKLLLTCFPSSELEELIERENLTGKVVFVPGVSQMDLASLFYAADIAINPSLAEGGFPFTFAEALSVNTPIVMSDNHVNREVLSKFKFSDRMLFNPLDILDIKNKILDCIENRQVFLNNQNTIALEMKSRTWEKVAEEYNTYLSEISDDWRNGD